LLEVFFVWGVTGMDFFQMDVVYGANKKMTAGMVVIILLSSCLKQSGTSATIANSTEVVYGPSKA
jgi:hypothetical protein